MTTFQAFILAIIGTILDKGKTTFMQKFTGILMVLLVIVIVGSILGLITASLLMLFNGGSFIGYGSIIVWVIIGGGILIWKISKGNTQ